MENPEQYLERQKAALTEIIGEACLEYYNYIEKVNLDKQFNSKKHLKYFLELSNRPFNYIKGLTELSESDPVELFGVSYKKSGVILCMMLQQHVIEGNILLHQMAAVNLRKVL